MEYTVLPVIITDQISMGNIWDKLLEDDLYKHLYYGGTVQSFMDFNKSFKGSAFFKVVHNESKEIASFVFLDYFQGYTAQFNYAVFKGFRRRLKGLQSNVLNQFGTFKRKDGSPYVRQVFGITPVVNRAATLYLKMAGFVPQFELKDSCDMYYLGGIYCNGLVSSYDFNN